MGILDMADFGFDVMKRRKHGLSLENFQERSAKGIYQLPVYVFAFCPCAETSGKNKRITGYFQSEKYFKDIRGILMDEFQVKKPPTRVNAMKIQELVNCNSVCVHIRRGDYLNPQWEFLNVCSEKYYQRGMDYIEQQVKNPVFYIFSNNSKEITWIKQNYHFTQKVNYIDLDNPDYEDLRLMYNCKHFVVSNSTFSWWGSYLSKSKNKIVIAPNIWQKGNARMEGAPIDVYRDDMVKIDVD